MLHDAGNDLFDAACELLENTRRLERAARRGDTVCAVPATLGCLQEALRTLADGCAALPGAAEADVADALHKAARACDQARASSAARSLSSSRS